ncbi:MAG TPA: DUF4153 domain-containing protein [bacterium]|jgi:hypothetical protein|nr:DUF4153 domain-containing protein [bacterium]HNW15832.1 DUF4153 domain-containing protein [bacterium]HPA57216.1 DUF4153 domain-containing protein [bacterium]HPG35072.1 DUF4153 domain-containing protein [bacterium]HPM46387.1 DUF4153 domain-containing protein [bacterium]
MKIVKYFFQDIPEKGEKAFKRFYLPLTVSMVSTFFVIFLLYEEKFFSGRFYSVENMAMALYLGVPVLLTTFLVAEYYKLNQMLKCIFGLSILAAVIFYYFSLPEKFLVTDTIRFILLSVFSFMTLFSFPIFLKKDRFVTRKIALFLYQRMMFAVIVAVLVYAGLSFAVYAIQLLFIPGWNDSFRLTSAIFAVSSGIIAPWVVMAGIPEIEKISEVEVVEKAAALISKFVFIPVVLFYLVILYLYFGKVLFFEELPKGMTSYLILSFCTAGSITYSIILEESKRAQKGITAMYEKWFYRTVFPLLFLLWYAIWKRTDDYGITEKRYILIVLSILLTTWASYFIFSKRKNIVIIPLLTSIVSIFISFGPWGMFETSYRSQKTRIIEILEKNLLLENGKIIPSTKDVSFEDRKNLGSALLYIETRWGLNRISEIIPENANISTTPQKYLSRYSGESSNTFKLMKWMGLKYVREWDNVENSESFSFYLNPRNGYAIKGPFDAMVSGTCPTYEHEKKEGTPKSGIRTEFDKECKVLKIMNDNGMIFELDLLPVIKKMNEKTDKTNYNLSVDQLSHNYENDSVTATVLITQAHGRLKSEKENSTISNISVSVYYFLKIQE